MSVSNRTAMPNLHLRRGRQNHSGYFEANHSSGKCSTTRTGKQIMEGSNTPNKWPDMSL